MSFSLEASSLLMQEATPPQAECGNFLVERDVLKHSSLAMSDKEAVGRTSSSRKSWSEATIYRDWAADAVPEAEGCAAGKAGATQTYLVFLET